MQYLLIISHDEHFAPTEQLFEDIAAWNAAMERRGAFVYGNPLRPPCDARTIRVREGKTVVTDGPFADSKEKMCAYVLLDCSSMDEATAAAAHHPMASAATIEVRPVWNELHALV
ncbi:MAG TPA: YciI family protein [Pseudomonadales bacterium]|nr:YciI family protein [Pseudomonadales bacterium]